MKKRVLWTAVISIYVLFIFSNSMKPADISSMDSGAVLRFVEYILTVAGLGSVGITEHIIRKAAHFSEYALLGILLFQCLKSYELTADRQILFHIVLGFMAPFMDETIQLFVEGRSGQLSDVWLDCAGVTFGTLLCLINRWSAGKQERKRDKKL